jgi:hypothetical protein
VLAHLDSNCRRRGPLGPRGLDVQRKVAKESCSATEIIRISRTTGGAPGGIGGRGIVGTPATVVLEDGEGVTGLAEVLAETVGLVGASIYGRLVYLSEVL